MTSHRVRYPSVTSIAPKFNSIFRVLNLLAAADRLGELPRLARLHKLTGDRAGQWSLSVNLPWVVCFTPARNGGWDDVEITDYH
jgi:toxin HigB-1